MQDNHTHKTVICLTPYPNDQDIRDGYCQRIENIDERLETTTRTYIYLSVKYNWHWKSEKKRDQLILVDANIILHFRKLMAILASSENVYIPSVSSLRLFFLPLVSSPGFRKKNIIFDVHGAYPEELRYNGHYLLSKLYEVLERFLFARATVCMFVTYSMQTYYLQKYPFISSRTLVVLPNLSETTLELPTAEQINFARELGITSADVVFIYSGNVQGWQNIPLMLDTIVSLSNPRYKFIILTLKVREFQVLINEHGLSGRGIIVKSVAPDELPNYYQLAHYGFVLRDPHILNQVACPTKMVEYLYHGIVPIVKSEDIGDFKELGYEFIEVEAVNDNMGQYKSVKNRDIVRGILSQMANIDVLKLLR